MDNETLPPPDTEIDVLALARRAGLDWQACDFSRERKDELRAYALAVRADLEVEVERLNQQVAAYTLDIQEFQRQLAQRDERIRELEEDLQIARSFIPDDVKQIQQNLDVHRRNAEAAEARVLELDSCLLHSKACLEAAEVRIKELEKVAGPDVVATLFGQNQRAMRAEQRAEAAEARVTELESRQWDPYPPDYRQKIEAAERSVELLRIENGMQHTKLVATELRLYELEQSAEVAARNMRDLVAEHVRERDALSERAREFQEALNTAQRCIVEAETERDALRARLEAIQKQPTIGYHHPTESRPGVELIERPE